MERNEQSTGETLDGIVRQSLQQRRHVLLQAGFEPAAVLSLEIDLVVMKNDCPFHRTILAYSQGVWGMI